MYLYIEDFILLNFIADFLVIKPVCAKNCISHEFLFCLSVCIVESIVVSSLLVSQYLYKNMFFKLLSMVVSTIVVTRPLNIKNLLKNLLLIFIYTFVLAGAVLFVKYFSFGDSFYTEKNMINIFELLVGFAIGTCFIYLLDTFVFNGISKIDGICKAKIIFDGKCFDNVYLFADTGNLLKTWSGSSVVVLNEKIVKKMCGIGKLSYDTYDEYLKFYEKSEYDNFRKVGITKINTVSGSKYLLTLKTDSIIFCDNYLVDGITIAGADFSNSGFDGIYNPIILQNGRKL